MSDSGEKTEEASPRQLEKARERGEVAQSKDLSGSLVLLVGLMILSSQADAAGTQMAQFARAVFSLSSRPTWSNTELISVFGQGGAQAGLALLPLLAGMFAIAAFVPMLQVGGLLTLATLQPKLEKLNPGSGFKRMFFSLQAYVELLKSTAKIIVVGVMFYQVIRGELPTILRLSDEPPTVVAEQTMRVAGKALTRVVLFYLAIGAMDFLYQRWQHARKLKMTREQVKQEHKEQEGSPETKSQRRHLQQEMAMQSMLHKVRKANVIVTNPDHIACALRYDPDSEDAPRLLGKGTGYLAEKIKEIAKEEDIPIVRDVSLAHAIFAMEEDQQIPQELFDAVAEVLKWVEMVLRSQGETALWLQPREEKSSDSQP